MRKRRLRYCSPEARYDRFMAAAGAVGLETWADVARAMEGHHYSLKRSLMNDNAPLWRLKQFATLIGQPVGYIIDYHH